MSFSLSFLFPALIAGELQLRSDPIRTEAAIFDFGALCWREPGFTSPEKGLNRN